MIRLRFLGLSALLAALSAPAWAGGKLWEKRLDSEVVWKQFHDAGVVLVVTEKGRLYGFDPKSGEEKFKVEDLLKPVLPDQIPGTPYVVPGTPYVLVVTKAGMIKPEVVTLLDVGSGSAVWTLGGEVPQVSWASLLEGKEPKDPPQGTFSFLNSAVLDPARKQIVLFFNGGVIWKGQPMKSKHYRMLKGNLVGADLATGKINFVGVYGGDDPMGYDAVRDNPLIVDGDRVIVDWTGLHAYSLVDGSERVSATFKRALKKGRYALKGATAGTVVEGDTAYLVVQDHVEAWNLGGKKLWEAESSDSAVPELHLAGDKLVARLGGVFCYTSAGKQECVQQDPYGVVVYDKATGKRLFHTKDWEKKSKDVLITPLAVSGRTVYWGTSARLIALDLDGLQVKFATEMSGNDPEENPGSVSLSDGKVLLMNTQTTAAFDPQTGAVLWTKTVAATKMDMAMRMAVAFTKAVAALDAANRAMTRANEGGLGSDSAWIRSTANQMGQAYGAGYDAMMKRVSAADASGAFNYVMTGKAKDAMIVGVSAKTGEVERGTQIEGRVPEFMVDPVTAVLVNVSKSDPKWVMGFDMSPPLPALN